MWVGSRPPPSVQIIWKGWQLGACHSYRRVQTKHCATLPLLFYPVGVAPVSILPPLFNFCVGKVIHQFGGQNQYSDDIPDLLCLFIKSRCRTVEWCQIAGCGLTNGSTIETRQEMWLCNIITSKSPNLLALSLLLSIYGAFSSTTWQCFFIYCLVA